MDNTLAPQSATSMESTGEFNNILVSREGKIATLTINRPDKLNALTIDTIAEIRKAMENLSEDDSVSAIILTGSGQKAFVAGADIAEFSEFSVEQALEMAQAGHQAFDYVENLNKPVIAAINGFALGGGLELAMACHIRLAATNARFGQPEINLGVVPGYGGTQRLPRLIGRSRATEMLLTGDMINAEEALALGLISHVCEPELLMAKAGEIADKISTKSPIVLAGMLELIDCYYDKSVDGFATEQEVFSQCFATADFKEGVSAFLEKRKPSFKGA